MKKSKAPFIIGLVVVLIAVCGAGAFFFWPRYHIIVEVEDLEKIQPGDRLLAVNDSPVGQLTLQELRHRLRGMPDSEVSLLLIGPEGVKTKEVTLARQMYDPASAGFSITEDGIMHFKVHRFAEGVAQTFKEALLDPKSERLTGIIIDLRDDIGGSISEVIDICSRLVRSGPIFILSGNNLSERFVARVDCHAHSCRFLASYGSCSPESNVAKRQKCLSSSPP